MDFGVHPPPPLEKVHTLSFFFCEGFPKGRGQKKNGNFFRKGGGGDPKVHNFEILNFGKFQVSKWASGMKRLFKVSFKN